MTAFNEFTLDTSAFLADTVHLTPVERGTYALILIMMHRSVDGWISEGELRGCVGERVHWHRFKASRRILDLLIERDGRYSQKRIQRDRQAFAICNATPSAICNAQAENSVGMDFATHKESNPLTLRFSLESESSLSVGSRAKARAKPRTALPLSWTLSEQGRAYAAEAGFGHGPTDREARAFANYHRAKGNTMADWEAAWRTWINNACKFAHRDQQRNGGGNGRGSVTEAWERLSGAVDEAEDREGGQGALLSLPHRPLR